MREFRNASKRFFNKILSKSGVRIVKLERYLESEAKLNQLDIQARILTNIQFTNETKIWLLDNLKYSFSQIQQDLFALLINNMKHNGYFVEFGAAGGLVGSNTYLLEKTFNWEGIVAEPAITYKSELNANRKCIIDNRCVFSESGMEVKFLQSKTSMLSTIVGFENNDELAKDRKVAGVYGVETISLFDLLKQHGAPHEIDYISIDTEGSEYEIISKFNFKEYKFSFISIEHNTREQEHKIQALLHREGYKRILASFSRFDSWYVRQDIDLSRIIVGIG